MDLASSSLSNNVVAKVGDLPPSRAYTFKKFFLKLDENYLFFHTNELILTIH